MFPSLIEITIEQAVKAFLDAKVGERYEVLYAWRTVEQTYSAPPVTGNVAGMIAHEGPEILAKEVFLHGPAKFGIDAFSVARGPIADALGSAFDHSALRGVLYARRNGIVEVCGRLRDHFVDLLKKSGEASQHLNDLDRGEVIMKSRERRDEVTRLAALACGCALWFENAERGMAENASGAKIRWEPDLILNDGSKGSEVGA